MLSKNPVRKSMIQESQKLLERPNTIVARPKAVTDRNRARPAFFIGGRWVSIRAIAIAPAAGAARSQPRTSSGVRPKGGDFPALSCPLFNEFYLFTTRFVVPVQSAVTILIWYTPEGITVPLSPSRFQTRLCCPAAISSAARVVTILPDTS